jgi:hypothetical protein
LIENKIQDKEMYFPIHKQHIFIKFLKSPNDEIWQKNLANLAGVAPEKKINPKNFTKKNTDAKLFHYFQRCQSVQAQEQILPCKVHYPVWMQLKKRGKIARTICKFLVYLEGTLYVLILPSQNRRHLTLTKRPLITISAYRRPYCS